MKTRIITRSSKRAKEPTTVGHVHAPETHGTKHILGALFFAVMMGLQTLSLNAGLTFTVDLYVIGGTYVFYTPMNTNDIGADAPQGIYTITSPGQPGNGSWRQFTYDANGFNTTSGGENGYSQLVDALQQITNGLWTLTFTSATTTNTYHFAVSLPGGLTTNQLSATLITFPADGASVLTNQPAFTWTGQPSSWSVSGSISVYQHLNNSSFYYPAAVTTAQTSWTVPAPIPASNPGSYTDMYLNYVTNYTADLFVTTTPTNISNGQALAGWAYNSTLESGDSVYFTVAAPPASSTSHTLVAHYAFDDINNLGLDSSTNNNDLQCSSSWGDNNYEQFTTDAEAGGGAVQFFGESNLNPCGGSPQFDNWTNALLGSFTVSAWIKTTNVVGSDDEPLNDWSGQNVIYVNNTENGVIPLGITGTKAAIATSVAPGAYGQDTLNSVGTVTSGSYVHVVVTRDAGSGLKQIYINGILDASGYGAAGILDGNADYASIGGQGSAPYIGKLDDVQIYAGVLNSVEVAYLYNHPGTPAPSLSLSGLVAHYPFDISGNLGLDASGSNNNIVYAGSFGGGNGPTIDTDHIGAAGGAVFFDGGSFFSAPTNVLPTLASSFSISLWVKTTQDNGDPYDLAYNGDAIISADIPYSGANDLIPAALTGGQIAFNTANTEYFYDDTINSSINVNDGEWHHVVVSRNQPTGEKFIYIDGVLDALDVDAMTLLNDPQLLTIGCKSDASDPDPASPSWNGENGYNGLLDDIQIYNRVLSPNEVEFLHDHPGSVITGTNEFTHYPVDVDLTFTIERKQDAGNEFYVGAVSINSITPEATTINRVRSFNNYAHSEQYPGGGGSGSLYLNSLDAVIAEFTNTWSIYINEGTPTQQVYSFQASITGLDNNLLRAVTVFSPTNGAVNVATNPGFSWHGLTNFSSLVVDLLSGPFIFPPVNTTSWPSPPTLNYGPDRFDVSYTSNNFPGVTFTMPMDASSNPIETWGARVNLTSSSFNYFVVGAPAPLPVLLTDLLQFDGNVQFSFQTLAGRPHIVQSRTNLNVGAWINLTNFVGNGSLQPFLYPTTNPPTQFFRVLTQ